MFQGRKSSRKVPLWGIRGHCLSAHIVISCQVFRFDIKQYKEAE